MPTSKILTILAVGAWTGSAITFGLHLAGYVPGAVLQVALACAICLFIRAGMEKNGAKQVKMAFRHGMLYGETRERKAALEQTVRIVTVPANAYGRAKVPDRDPAPITLPGQRPIN